MLPSDTVEGALTEHWATVRELIANAITWRGARAREARRSQTGGAATAAARPGLCSRLDAR